MATVYLALLGRRGCASWREQNLAKAEYAKARVREIRRVVAAVFGGADLQRVRRSGCRTLRGGPRPRARARDLLGGLDLAGPPPGGARLGGPRCVHHELGDAAADRSAPVVEPRRHEVSAREDRRATRGNATQRTSPTRSPLLFERSRPGRVGYALPALDVPRGGPREAVLPDGMRADDLPGLPGALRGGRGAPLHAPLHLERRRRPRALPARLVHDEVQPEGERAWRRGCRGSRGPPACSPAELQQGLLLALPRVPRAQLAEVSGMDRVTLQPAAGAQGELAGS